MTKRRMKFEKDTRLKPLALGTTVGAAAMLAALVLAAVGMSLGSVPHSLVGPMVILIFIIGGFAGGYTAAKQVPSGGFYMAAACGIMLCLMVLAAGLISNTSRVGSAAAVKIAVVLVSAVMGGFSGTNSRYKRR